MLQAFTNGRGFDIDLDMHRSTNHNNLLSNIDLGLGQRPWLSSGDARRGAHAGGLSAHPCPSTSFAVCVLHGT